MSKAARRRNFLRWKKFRRQCGEATGESVPLTLGMCLAWTRAVYKVKDGEFYSMPPWHCDRSLPLGSWEPRRWGTVE